MVAARRHDLMYSQSPEHFPVTNRHMCIDKRRLHAIMQRFFLRFRKRRHEIRHHRLVTSQYTVLARHATQFAVPCIADAHTLPASWSVVLFGINTVVPSLLRTWFAAVSSLL